MPMGVRLAGAFKVQASKELKRVLSAKGQLDMTNWSTPYNSSRTRLASSMISTAGPSWRSDRPRSMAGRSPGSDTAKPPEAESRIKQLYPAA